MKKFFIRSILIFFIFIILTISPSIILIISHINEPDKNNYLFAQLDKEKMLKETLDINKQRIIFVGGSNLAFGLDSKKIEKTLNTKHSQNVMVINTGLHAGIGLNRMLKYILPVLRSGDIVVVTPEYGQFTYGSNGMEAAWNIELDIKKTNILKCRRDNFLDFPANFDSYCKHRLMHCLDGAGTIYKRSGFNDRGDNISHLNVEPNKKIQPIKMLTKLYNEKYVQYFKNYLKILQQNGVTVLYSYPCLQKESYLNGQVKIENADQYLRKNLNIKFLGTADNYAFDTKYFFDFPYHLNKEGRDLRTDQFIKDFLEYYYDTYKLKEVNNE